MTRVLCVVYSGSFIRLLIYNVKFISYTKECCITYCLAFGRGSENCVNMLFSFDVINISFLLKSEHVLYHHHHHQSWLKCVIKYRMLDSVFWAVTPCRLAGMYQRFG